MPDLDEKLDELQEQIKNEMGVLKLDSKSESSLQKQPDETVVSPKNDIKEHKGYMDRETYIRKHGSDEGYKDKETFDRDGSFFKKIEAQNRKIDELIEFNRQSIEHGRKVEKAAYEKALRDLQIEKIELIKNADAEGVIALEQRAEVVKEQIKEFEKPIPINETNNQVLDAESIYFKERNSSWINGSSEEDKRMQAMSRAVISYLQETEPNISSKDAVDRIENELKEKFPKRFENQYKDKPALITLSTTDRNNKKSDLIGKLTQQQKDFVKKAKKYGSKLTEEEYAKQLELTGDLRDE